MTALTGTWSPRSSLKERGWRIIPTTVLLSTSMDMGCKVLGTVDTEDAQFHILPGTPHEVHLGLDETRVVGNTNLFNLLV